MSSDSDSRFLFAAAAVGVAGSVLATVTPVAAGASAAFTGSLVTSGVLGTVFAVRNFQLFRRHGTVSIPPAVTTVVFGLWYMVAPLLYDVGFLATAGTQLAGLLTTSFVFYMAVAGATEGLE